MENYTVTAYFLNHRRKNDDEWRFSNLDVFYVGIPEYKKKYDCWVKCGKEGWMNKNDATQVLIAMVDQYPEYDFRMVEITYAKTTKGMITIENR